MPTWEIEQYELHSQTFRVEALDEAEAIQKLFSGEAKAIADKLTFVETAYDFGLPVDEHQELADDLRTLEVGVGEAVIPSIRSVRQCG
jgi:type III secretion system FlhB-like substrate exporter